MAVDSRNKRFSLLGFGQAHGFPIVFFNPDGTNAASDGERSQYLYLYQGISIVTGQPTPTRWGGIPYVRVGRNPFGRSW